MSTSAPHPVSRHPARRPGWQPTPFLLGSAAAHAAGVVALGLAPERWPLVAGALLADHVLIAAAGLWPQSRLLGPNLDRLPTEAAQRGEVALTFDDGPDPAVTPRVLELLAERRGADAGPAGATFFCIGRRAAAHPELVGEIVRRGHRVENHSYSHPAAFTLYRPAALEREVRRAQEVLAEAAGRPPRLFRAPAGFRSFLLEPVLRAQSLALVSWTRRGFDTVASNPERVAGRLLRTLSAGDVLLLHDGSTASDRRGRKVVLEVLPRVLDALTERGLRAVPLPSPAGTGAPAAADRAAASGAPES